MLLPLRFQETSAGRFLPKPDFLHAVQGRRVAITANHDRDFHGPLFNATAYFAIGTFFMVLVFYYLWNTRFLIVTAFFYTIACMALSDILASRRLTFYRVDTVDAGDAVSFATPSLAEAQQVVAAVTR